MQHANDRPDAACSMPCIIGAATGHHAAAPAPASSYSQAADLHKLALCQRVRIGHIHIVGRGGRLCRGRGEEHHAAADTNAVGSGWCAHICTRALAHASPQLSHPTQRPAPTRLVRTVVYGSYARHCVACQACCNDPAWSIRCMCGVRGAVDFEAILNAFYNLLGRPHNVTQL